MKVLARVFFLALFGGTSLAVASPSESNHFQIEFKGADAENFKAKQISESSREYGPYGSHIMHDYSLGFSKQVGESANFRFLLECQQRILNYRSENAELLAPTCSFSYSTVFFEAGEKVIDSYTQIDVTPDIAKKMIQNLEWKEYQNTGRYYFGCYDNRDSGCPNIRYTPASASKDALVEISYYKP
ncbi:hypothetical protein GW916_03740 [bacterium]|nr:hypothetical protein [bacterium]